MKVNFEEVKITDIDGKEMEGSEVHKIIGNYLYNSTNDIDYVDIAMEINKGGEIDLKRKQVEYIRDTFKGQPSRTAQFAPMAFVRSAIVKYLDNLLGEDD